MLEQSWHSLQHKRRALHNKLHVNHKVMLNIRTHVLLCITLGIFFGIALVISLQPVFSMLTSQSETSIPENVVLLFYINFGAYFIYALIVLYRVIKYVPKKQ